MKQVMPNEFISASLLEICGLRTYSESTTELDMGQNNNPEAILLYFIQFCVIVPSLLAISLVLKLIHFVTFVIRDITFQFGSSDTNYKHKGKVLKIQEQVILWNMGGRKSKMVTARPAWKTVALRNYEKKNLSKICLGKLEEIIEIDTKNKLIRVEPGMSLGALTAKLVPMGWTIPVVPELEFLTIGGCICGAGLESSSHKYGLLVDTCVSYEVILSDGSLITCSKDENQEVFYSIGMSHGTIGFLVGVTFRLIRAAKYVKLEYIHSKSVTDTEKLLRAPENEFIEGIIYDKSNAVVMYGNFVDQPPSNCRINNLLRWYKPWFYKHVETFLNKSGRHVEYIPTRDYYHRHQRSLFWEIEPILPFGNHPVFRYFLGWILPFNIAMLKRTLPMTVLDVYIYSWQHIMQDFILPLSKLKQALDFSHDLVQIYPIWLCPVRHYPTPNMTGSAGKHPGMYVDIGIYGSSGKYLTCSMKEAMKQFEKFTLESRGFQGLYADSYLSKEEFEQMFDLTLYNNVRDKLKCDEAFPHVYDKVSHVARKL